MRFERIKPDMQDEELRKAQDNISEEQVSDEAEASPEESLKKDISEESVKSENRKEIDRNGKELLPYIVLPLILLAISIAVFILFRHYNNSLEGANKQETYGNYYVMIPAEHNSSFWDAVYRGAFEAGKKSDTYVEKMSESLYGDYSAVELIQMATASGADGIIVCSDESEEMCGQINDARRNGIPVVTLLSDSSQSDRCSFVGISYYNLGKIYGNEIAKIAKERTNGENGTEIMNKAGEPEPVRVAVLMDSTVESSGQNILISEINDVLDGYADIAVNVEVYPVDDTNSFSVEESVSGLFSGKDRVRPDIVVCLSDTETMSAYQMVVDYNLVGHVSILGYYDSEAICKAIDRGAIYATVTVDTDQMGEYCVQALDEYRSLGNTSQYLTTDLLTIDKSNVADYLKEGDGNE